MLWVVMVISGILEAAWAADLNVLEGLAGLWPSSTFAVTLALGMVGQAFALRTIPPRTGYAAWVSIGADPSGLFFIGEGFSVFKALCPAMTVAGVVGLSLAE